MKVALVTKKEKLHVNNVIELANNAFSDVTVFSGHRLDPFPEKLEEDTFDLIISYIGPWIIPENVLNKTKKWNINFHPGPPEYPGIGCFNFALHNNENSFGTTAHLMQPKVDTGKIIDVDRFKIAKDESVESLSIKTYNSLFRLYENLIKVIIKEEKLKFLNLEWKRTPFKRSDLEKLCLLDLKMSKEEFEKTIRCTYYPDAPAPYIVINGYKFEYNPDR